MDGASDEVCACTRELGIEVTDQLTIIVIRQSNNIHRDLEISAPSAIIVIKQSNNNNKYYNK